MIKTASDLKTLASLTPGERRLLAEALLLLPCVALGLRVLGYRRVLDKLRSWAPPLPVRLPSKVPADGIVDTAVWAIRVASGRGPYRATCLRRSIALWWMLRRRGIRSDIRLGVGRKGSGADIEAHAWVEQGGRVLNDSQDVALRFPPFADPH